VTRPGTVRYPEAEVRWDGNGSPTVLLRDQAGEPVVPEHVAHKAFHLLAREWERPWQIEATDRNGWPTRWCSQPGAPD
jgi:hypothetical protein